MDIGIVIPYYENSPQAKERFEYLLNTLLDQYSIYVKVVIVVDGGKVDWLERYRNPFEIIVNEKHEGVSKARNIGIDYLIDNYAYIGFIDSDDSISNDYIIEALKTCYEGYDYIDTRFIQDGVEVFGTFKGEEKRKNIVKCGVAGCFFKSSIIGDNRFDTTLQIGEDSKFSSKVVDLTKHTKGLSKGIYNYNKWVNPESLTCKYAKNEISKEK